MEGTSLYRLDTYSLIVTKYEMRSRDFSEFTVGTLASLSAAVVGTKIDAARLNGCSVQRLKYNMDYDGKVAGTASGPLLYGLVLELSVTEIAEFFAADPQSRVDEAALEESQRRILVLGAIGQSQLSGQEAGEVSAMKRGKWPGWPIIEGEGVSHFIFNRNPGDPMPTGMFFQIYTEMYGEWARD